MSDAYLNTVKRIEPEIAPVDLTAAAASIAVSLKRIADAQEIIALMAVNSEGGRMSPNGTLDRFARAFHHRVTK